MRNKLYLWLRSFDVYQGRNPLKLFLRLMACKMRDYQESRKLNMIFLNKNFTACRKCQFSKFILLSLMYRRRRKSDKENGIEITKSFLNFGEFLLIVFFILVIIISISGLGLGIFEMVKGFMGEK